MPPKAKQAGQPIVLERLNDDKITVPIIGSTPVIPHKWSEKALGMMRAKQFGQTVKVKRDPKDPEEDAIAATYWIDQEKDLAGIPAVSFKGAMVSACRFFEGLSMTEARTLFYVEGIQVESDILVPIIGEKKLREDTTRNATGVADIRYRYQWWPWRCELTVRYPTKILAPNSVLALIDGAGRVGVGDWRPGSPKSNTGTYGVFRIDTDSVEISEAIE